MRNNELYWSGLSATQLRLYSQSTLRQIVQQCWNGSTDGQNNFDWTHVYKHVVVDLEGKSGGEIPIRAELVRSHQSCCVPCDATRDPPIPPRYLDQYDVVTDILCLVSACATREDYAAALVRLHALLKPGGKLCCTHLREKRLQPQPFIL